MTTNAANSLSLVRSTISSIGIALLVCLGAGLYALGAVFVVPVIIITGRLGLPERSVWHELLVGVGEVLAFEAVLLPCAFGSWVVLWQFGMVWAIMTSIAGTVLWLTLVGVPAPAAGSKIAGMGFVLTILSNAACLITSLVLLVLHLTA